MKKTAFYIEVSAISAEQAYEAARPRELYRKTGWRRAEPELAPVLREVQRKRQRALENGPLYLEKVQEYDRMLLEAAEPAVPEYMRTARLMVAHGDARIDHPEGCCVMAAGMNRWLVFGVAFT